MQKIKRLVMASFVSSALMVGLAGCGNNAPDNTTVIRSGFTTGSTLPTTGVAGDLFLNTTNGTLYSWNGTAFTPVYTFNQAMAGGTMFYSGAGAPTATTAGTTGDLYLNTTTGDLYRKAADGSWTMVANLRGPQGLPGTNGTNGTNGTPGTNGTNGTNASVTTVAIPANPAAPNNTNCAQTGGIRVTTQTGSAAPVVTYVCNGAAGTNGLTSLVTTERFEAGATPPVGVIVTCADGAGYVVIRSGLDDSADGTLQAAEVDQTSVVCDGARGSQIFNGTLDPNDPAFVAPANPMMGDYYLDTTTGNLYYYDGTTWDANTADADIDPIANLQGPSGPAGAPGVATLTTATRTVDGVVNAFGQCAYQLEDVLNNEVALYTVYGLDNDGAYRQLPLSVNWNDAIVTPTASGEFFDLQVTDPTSSSPCPSATFIVRGIDGTLTDLPAPTIAPLSQFKSGFYTIR